MYKRQGEETIASWADDFGSPDDEYRSALLELSKRSTTSKNPYATYMRRLLSRGYSYDLATRVVRDYLSGPTSGS